MKETHYFYVPRAEQHNELPTDEAIHATRVLRLKEGDEIFLMDGVGNFFRSEVTLASSKKCFYSIKEVLPQKPIWNGKIRLAIAPTKDIGRIEWMVEKATEIGIDEVDFLSCQFSERKQIRVDRIEKIVISAMKQSRKAWKPVVSDLCSFKDFLGKSISGKKYLCHCYNEFPKKDLFSELCKMPSFESITVLVGPEGDFSVKEVEKALDCGFESVSLGKSRLRTETAGLYAVMLANLSKR